MLTSAYPGGLYGDLMTVPGGVRGAPAADGYDAAAEAAMAPWLVVLTAGAKKLMTGFVILGVLLIAGQSALEVVATSNAVTTADASYQLQTDVIPVGTAISDYPADGKACHGALPCSTALDRRVATTLDTFADQVRGIDMPSDRASAAGVALAASTSQVASIFSHLAAATSAIQYLFIAASSGLQQAVAQMNQDYINLRDMLSGS